MTKLELEKSVNYKIKKSLIIETKTGKKLNGKIRIGKIVNLLWEKT